MILVSDWINHLQWEIGYWNTNSNHNKNLLIPTYTLLFLSFLFSVSSYFTSNYLYSFFGLSGIIIAVYGLKLNIAMNPIYTKQIEDMEYLLNYILLYRIKEITVGKIQDSYIQIKIKHTIDISEDKKKLLLSNLKKIRTQKPKSNPYPLIYYQFVPWTLKYNASKQVMSNSSNSEFPKV